MIIEKLYAEIDEVKSSREEERQRLRNTARNILRLGLSVEQVTQATGLPQETVQALAAQLN
jgi:predicted transposase YdaD